MSRLDAVVLVLALTGSSVILEGINQAAAHSSGYSSRGPRIPTPYQSLAPPQTAIDALAPGPAPTLPASPKTRRAFFPEGEDDGDNHHADDDSEGRGGRRLPGGPQGGLQGGPSDQEALLLGLLAHKQGTHNHTAPDNPRGVQGSLMDMLSKSEYSWM